MRVLDLPIVVCGERKEPSDRNYIAIPYGSDLEVRIPALERSDVENMRSCTNSALRSLHIDDIAIFMNEVGSVWLDGKSELRRLAIEYAAETNQYLVPSIYYD